MKKTIGIVIVIVIVIALVYFFIFSKDRPKSIEFTPVEEEDIPAQIAEILPNYRMKEKALVCKVNDEIYVVVTRGEKASAGYEVEIKKIYLENVDNEMTVRVVAEFTDPKPGEVQAQILTYPYTIVKTELEELPTKVVLDKEYKK
ncbi:protease complex subunit PrcB family protein [Sedimentibacter sp. zth1]|uniref:protease complex subunit PrcB family protein n=1 Tax=Sedimentibacter sp. zth1 TaxID=2816908 RepID=UPI001A92F562|nr:protease complex subunit PrcB family protein [Sedimentibacter sp. zth1]QSX06131.1 protease complex subunit PrcB family protein [Sedimentibacter sp. zth1]